MSSETISHPSRHTRRAGIRSLADTARTPLSAACLTALMATASCSPVIAQDADFDRALAFVTDSARSVILSTYPDAVIHALDDALVVEADDATLAQIAILALRYEPLPDPRELALMHEAVYPQAAPLQWSSCVALVNGSGPTAMIVAFKPPVAPALLTALAGTGAQVIGALPPSAFLVRADSTAAGKLDALSDLVGACTPYLPAHRISDRVPKPPSVGTVDIDVLTYPGVSGAALAASYSPSTVSTVLDREVVRLRIPVSQVAGVAARSEVEWIDLGEHERAPFNSQMRVVMQTEKIHAQGNPAFFNPIYSLGVWGESQIVTVADTGVEPHPAFAGPVKLLANTAAGACVTVLDDAAVHGISVLGVLAGDRIGPTTGQFGTANGMDGLAVRSPTIMQDIESHTGTFCPPDDYPTALFQPALDQGSQIHNNSWGHWAGQGRYSWRSQAIDRHLALRSAREQVVVFSVGNAGAVSGSGPALAYTLSDEAHAKNSVSVGGSLNGPARDWMYHFSSRGPAADC
ncbi:MAG TPA: hypothetical protein DDZ76_15525, partial [Xanthomonadales bacterium]|nr:hypothetical protein [Xanthomonadales bacterium]